MTKEECMKNIAHIMIHVEKETIEKTKEVVEEEIREIDLDYIGRFDAYFMFVSTLNMVARSMWERRGEFGL